MAAILGMCTLVALHMLILLSASLINLQKCLTFVLIKVVNWIFSNFQFNPSKSCLFRSGPGYNQLLPNLHMHLFLGLINLNIWVYILTPGK